MAVGSIELDIISRNAAAAVAVKMCKILHVDVIHPNKKNAIIIIIGGNFN